MRYVLGIDQGGTKTLAALADERGKILGLGAAPGASHVAQGKEFALEQIEKAAQAAAAQAGMGLESVECAGAGLTGADFDHEFAMLEGWLREIFPQMRVHVENDCMIALRAGSQSPNAAIVCGGTGMNCGVRRADGKEYLFGYYIDNEWQGGGAIARKALSYIFAAHIGMEKPTAMTKSILSYYGFPDVDALMVDYGYEKLERLSGFARQVGECAQAGDEAAKGILADFGHAWARYALHGLRELGIAGEEVDVVLSGGIFKSGDTTLRDTMVADIRSGCPRARITEARYEPVVGGVLLALEKSGLPVDQVLLEQSAAALDLIRIRGMEA